MKLGKISGDGERLVEMGKISGDGEILVEMGEGKDEEEG